MLIFHTNLLFKVLKECYISISLVDISYKLTNDTKKIKSHEIMIMIVNLLMA